MAVHWNEASEPSFAHNMPGLSSACQATKWYCRPGVFLSSILQCSVAPPLSVNLAPLSLIHEAKPDWVASFCCSARCNSIATSGPRYNRFLIGRVGTQLGSPSSGDLELT